MVLTCSQNKLCMKWSFCSDVRLMITTACPSARKAYQTRGIKSKMMTLVFRVARATQGRRRKWVILMMNLANVTERTIFSSELASSAHTTKTKRRNSPRMYNVPKRTGTTRSYELLWNESHVRRPPGNSTTPANRHLLFICAYLLLK